MNSSGKLRVVQFGPLSSGHIQKWTSLLGSSFEVNYLTLGQHNGECNGPKYSLPVITNTRLDFILNFPMICMYIWRIKPSVIHVHYFSSYGLIGALIPCSSRKVLSVWGSDVNDIDIRSLLVRKLYGFVVGRYDYINSAAKHLTDKLLLIKPELNIETYQYGVDNIPDVDTFKSICNRESEIISFCSPRNFASLYRIEFLIESFYSMLNLYDCKAVLYVYGHGREEEVERIKSLCDGVKTIFVGKVDHSILISNLINHDILVSVPIKDGTPLSVLEGVAYGCIPVLSDIRANRSMFRSENAFFASENDLGSKLYDAYRFVLSSEKGGVLLENYYKVNREASLKINVKRLEAAYLSLN